MKKIKIDIGEPKQRFKYLKYDFLKKKIELLNKYPKAEGKKSLIYSINYFINKRNNLNINIKSNIIPSLGNRDALFTIMNLFNKKKYIIITEPFYPSYRIAETFFKKKIIYIKSRNRKEFMKNFRKVPEYKLKKTSILIICSPNNPMGYILKKKNIIEILNISKKYKFKIISDECYSEVYFKKPISLIKLVYKNLKKNNFFLINSLSKISSVPGLRSGFIISSVKNIKKILDYKRISGTALSDFNQEISKLLWMDFKRIIKIRNNYKSKIISCFKILKKINVKKPKGGFYLMINTNFLKKESKSFCKKIYNKYKIIISNCNTFFKKNKKNFYSRIALVESKKKCKLVCKKILKIINDIRKKNKKKLEK
ncbi:aminotransferase class I/II-fold pyridoxal phosphate-dependent enzyme [Candidatus Vidania fulgoroideorum]